MSELAPRLLKPLTDDLQTEGIGLCYATCQAQAQECFFESALLRSTSEALLSKLAQGTYTLYRVMAVKANSSGIKEKLHATWGIFAAFQMTYHQAEAQFRCGAGLYAVPADGVEEVSVSVPDEPKVRPHTSTRARDYGKWRRVKNCTAARHQPCTNPARGATDRQSAPAGR
jgi:hypothetical protein